MKRENEQASYLLAVVLGTPKRVQGFVKTKSLESLIFLGGRAEFSCVFVATVKGELTLGELTEDTAQTVSGRVL
jgi:hypothetical protein